MKTITINFCDFWSDFNKTNNIIFNHLKNYYSIQISDNPQFLFCGPNIYSNKRQFFSKSNCVKILIATENLIPNFNIFDYATGNAYLEFGNRYIRLPAYSLTPSSKDILDRSAVNQEMTKRKFCNFIYRNSSWPGTKNRNEFCKKLQKYKFVDCPGKVLNNINCPDLAPRTGDWYKSKQEFLTKYKFTIAFENSISDGYTTEKLIQPFYAYSIPIYWGNPSVSKEFNPKAFINCNDYNNDFDAVIEKVKELDNDDDKYLEMLKQPPILNLSILEQRQRFKEWLIMIIERGNYRFDKGIYFNSF